MQQRDKLILAYILFCQHLDVAHLLAPSWWQPQQIVGIGQKRAILKGEINFAFIWENAAK